MKIIKKIFQENKLFFFNYNHNSFFEGMYRLFAILISPIFIKFNPNLISFLSLFIGFIGLFFSTFLSLDIRLIIIFFLLSFILDFTDGLVARHTNKSSFYGRFIDGLFDIFVIGFLHIVLLMHLIVTGFLSIDKYYFVFFLVTICIMPIQHLILDRFSALARWCNEINKNKYIRPYYRNTFFSKLTMTFFDLQHLSLFLILFTSLKNLPSVIILYFILSFSSSILSIIIYITLSKKNFNKISNKKDNYE
jgi:phosphatidylserine synthase